MSAGATSPPSLSLFKAACSPSNRAASSALGTELFATNAVRISAANSIGSDVATSALGLGLRSVTLTPELPLRRESGALLLQRTLKYFRSSPKRRLDQFKGVGRSE